MTHGDADRVRRLAMVDLIHFKMEQQTVVVGVTSPARRHAEDPHVNHLVQQDGQKVLPKREERVNKKRKDRRRH